ncbi:MAG: hypothetical protein R3C45_10235 [Phycisphaerales bacterium]
MTINPLKTGTRLPQLTGTVVDLDPATAWPCHRQRHRIRRDQQRQRHLDPARRHDHARSCRHGVYSVLVVGTDSSGNTGNDQTSGELLIDNAAPVVTVNTLRPPAPRLRSPARSMISTSSTDVSVMVNGNIYAAINNGNGTWTLAAEVISPALRRRVRGLRHRHRHGRARRETTPLPTSVRIDTIAPLVTIDAGTKDSGSPELTGTVTDADPDTLSRPVNSNIYAATNNGDGTWTLQPVSSDPVLSEGNYTKTWPARPMCRGQPDIN